MESLLRTQVGPFYLEESVRLGEIEQLRDAGRLSEVIQPIDSVFQSYRARHLTKAGDRLVQNGNPVEAVPELIADVGGKMDESDGGTLGFRRAILEDDNLANIDSLYNAAVAVDKFYSQECREW